MSNNPISIGAKKTNFRWVVCALLFVATTVNYLDRQVLSLTWKDFIAEDFHWTDSQYGTITGIFSLAYAIACLFAGKFIDWLGTKKGYLWAIFIWSIGACLHAACGWATMQLKGIESIEVLRAVEAGSAIALAVSTSSVVMFIFCRTVLAIGESGNFPAAIKVTAEYFPKKDRAFATSIFNAGASIGALIAPATIPLIAAKWGWESAFIIIGALGFVWMFFWMGLYEKPEKSKFVNQSELEYINQDDAVELAALKADEKVERKEEKTIPFFKCFTFRQTWAFISGKFFTDGVWWFFLFWAPAYFSDQYGYRSDSKEAIMLIFTLYLIVTVLSIGGGYLPKYFVEKRGMEPYPGRMKAMLIFAFFPLLALFAQPLGQYSAWFPAIIIGLAGAGHQAWSANLYSTIGDMFPKSTIGTITGVGTTMGGLASFMINKGAGMLFTKSEQLGTAFNFMGFQGKEAGYMIVFCICAVVYLVGWLVMKSLVPKYKPIIVD
jgi:ACS family hexuronate transporter-like MFS transporter